ncbi:MAG: addiction module protein [Candidatus Cyclonatronum sp.]|uniref:addiction module protein n=1 Tax=Cyclonatronum sp. TaxID=3024185 RepID=UPI0025C3766C|nr:addiction module protein [Cyclonatronum sp.]MCH8485563.1 addiction module protein [Cyclonatronum sp.]
MSMDANFAQVKSAALKLGENDRAELAKKLLLSLDPNDDDDVRQAWEIELEKRLSAAESGQVSYTDGEGVHKTARKLFSK